VTVGTCLLVTKKIKVAHTGSASSRHEDCRKTGSRCRQVRPDSAPTKPPPTLASSPKRVKFKLCLLAYKAVHSLAPQYLADFCRPVSSVDSRQRLRSAARDDLVIDSTCTKFGARSFAVAAPLEWNRLPHHIRALPSIDSFKAALKTYLFDCS